MNFTSINVLFHSILVMNFKVLLIILGVIILFLFISYMTYSSKYSDKNQQIPPEFKKNIGNVANIDPTKCVNYGFVNRCY